MTGTSFARKDNEELDFDLVVVGGGLSGLCAALAAARNGTRTAIVQDRPVFGGNSSSEIRVVPLGAASGAAWAAETGIVHELILADRATNHQSFFDHGLINSHYDFTLAEAARQQDGLAVYLNTSVRGVHCIEIPLSGRDDDYTRTIASLQASQLGSEKEFIFRAKQFIDATGDGTVGALAGAEYRYGREARSEFAEPLAPIAADDGTLGSTITMRARKIDRPAPYKPPTWVAQYTSPSDFVLDRQLYHLERDNFGGYWWLEVNAPFHQIDDNQAIRDELHRHVLGVWNYLKNHSPEKERFADYVLDWMGTIPGKRESRRLIGDVTITENDLHLDRRWPDSIAYASWWIDLHVKGGVNNRTEPAERENIDQRYSNYVRIVPASLPLRAYYSRNVSNLWLAGRNLSASHIGIGPVRVMLSLAAQAQAVGTAASYAQEHQLTPRQTADPDGPHIEQLRQRLIEQDARILGARNTDPRDLARLAAVTASSSIALEMPDPARMRTDDIQWLPLDVDRAQVVPLTCDTLESASFYVRNDDDREVRVHVQIEQIERIWDQHPGLPAGEGSLVIPSRHEGWIELTLSTHLESPRPHRIILSATEGIAWAAAASDPVETETWTAAGSGPPGTVAQYLTVSPGGPESKNGHLEAFSYEEIDLPGFSLWRQYRKGVHAVRLSPEQRPFEASEVTNGAAWVEDLPNLWISQPIVPGRPEWLQLDWATQVTFDNIQVSFDTDLDIDTSQRPLFYRAPRSAENWRIMVKSGSHWSEIFAEVGNVQRKHAIKLPTPVTASAIRIDVFSANGGGSVGIFEVRVRAAQEVLLIDSPS